MKTNTLLKTVSMGFLALGLTLSPVFAGHEHDRLYYDVKSLDSVTNELLNDYVCELKRTCNWKPCGREKILYDAICEFERCVDQVREALKCNDMHAVKKHVCATREAADRVNRAASCLYLPRHIREVIHEANDVLCAVERGVSQYTYRPPAPVVEPEYEQSPGEYRRGSARGEVFAHVLAAIFEARRNRHRY